MIELTESNSWTCEMHPDLKCRLYPRTLEALRKHYKDAQRHAESLPCMHELPKALCHVCRGVPVEKRRTGRGPRKKAMALKRMGTVRQSNAGAKHGW